MFQKLYQGTILLLLLGCVALLMAIQVSIQDLAENKNWPEKVTEINHNQYDVAVSDGGIIGLPAERYALIEDKGK